MRPTQAILLASLLAVASCGWKGPELAGEPGLQYRIESFYRDRAWERNATCLQPRMDITSVQILEDTPERMVLDVRYYWQDNVFGNDDDGRFGVRVGVGGCSGFSQRTFVLDRTTGGDLVVRSMTGPQRDS
ncbi:hypothetical protein [Marinimicrococcus flavescens]|uniref:Lipoprotein n=1 Tax=Marinimicrococcus flavescens TaxID=3031815 RepID=A0AAP3XRY0_9PROT|nr:hypothetical protein [Marinimicrococcus flavescens]